MTFTRDDVEEIVALLDTICWACGGNGGDCEECNGVGHKLTNAGEDLIQFLKLHRAKWESSVKVTAPQS